MKRIFLIALTVCAMVSALCVTVFAAPDLVAPLQKSTDLAAIEGYIMLAIAVAGLIATIVSVILLTTSAKRKEAAARRKNKAENKEEK